jgi:excinuclease ABC subunit C
VTRIDVFDNAQLFGTAPISAVIVYDTKNFEKKSYRKYHLKTTTNDDYQAMREVTYRRYQKLMVESGAFPDVILVDGGLGQVHAAEEVITELGLEIPVCGLKKNKRHQLEGLVYLGQTKILKPNDVLFKFLIKLSEEVHRFAITFHRKTSDKLAYASKLDDIEGIGPKRKARLIQQFGTFERIQEASFEALKQSGLPEALIKKIKEHA